jgi:hypothetical protein
MFHRQNVHERQELVFKALADGTTSTRFPLRRYTTAGSAVMRDMPWRFLPVWKKRRKRTASPLKKQALNGASEPGVIPFVILERVFVAPQARYTGKCDSDYN